MQWKHLYFAIDNKINFTLCDYNSCALLVYLDRVDDWSELRVIKTLQIPFFFQPYLFYTLVNRQLSGCWNFHLYCSHIPGLVYPMLTCRLHNIWFLFFERCSLIFTWVYETSYSLLVELLPLNMNYFPFPSYIFWLWSHLTFEKKIFLGRTTHLNFFLSSEIIIQS